MGSFKSLLLGVTFALTQPTASWALCSAANQSVPPDQFTTLRSETAVAPPAELEQQIAYYCARTQEGDIGAHRSIARLFSDDTSPLFDLQAAASHYRRAIELGHVESHYALAFVLQDLGDGEGALAALEAAAAAGREAAELRIANGHLRGWFGEASHPSTGFSLLKALAAAGDGEAQLDLAEAYTKGLAVEPDLNAAAELYRSAARPDRPAAFVGLGRALLALEKGEEARAALEAALEFGDPRAEYELARGHYLRSFGTASLPDQGRNTLVALAENGDLGAIRMVVRMPIGRVPADFQGIERHLKALSEEDDPWAIETLVLLYRTHPNFAAVSVAARSRLLETQGSLIRDKTRGRELIRLLMDPGRPEPSFDTILATLDRLSPEGYEAALRELSKMHRNHYIRVIQRELRDMGHYRGRVDGLMGPRTVSAICEFCKMAGIKEICMHGPLTSASLNAMASAITSSRHFPPSGAGG